MTDSPSDDARDDFILQERLSGRSARSISKELHCAVGDVHAALDRVLPTLDQSTRLRHISLDLHRLEGLLEVFYKRAIEKQDVQAGLCVVKILERKSALLGLDAAQRIDLAVQSKPAETGYEKITATLMQLKHGPQWQPDDPTSDGDGPARQQRRRRILRPTRQAELIRLGALTCSHEFHQTLQRVNLRSRSLNCQVYDGWRCPLDASETRVDGSLRCADCQKISH